MASPPVRPPNVIVIITDDQGYGDLGVHGNPRIRTPNLDRLARQSVRLKQFYVCPVCSPTRASLLTGRYNYRTGVVDTYLGRSLMHPDEVTLAERLMQAGYRTGIFGKWHLGDNVPLRPLDQGFQQALVLKGGGIGQPSDLPGGSHYFNPVLLHNGQPRHFAGYCSDVFTSAAIDFLRGSSDRPFFLYLAFNCPHDPLEAPEADLKTYQNMKLGRQEFPSGGNSLPRSLDEDKIARVYAMVTNIDSNVGRLLEVVESTGIAGSTIIVFMTDNGPAFPRFNAGLRGLKGTVYEGGIRVPCYVRWPGHFPAGLVVDRMSAHIDIVPTILEACGVSAGTEPRLDGLSLLPLLRGEPVSSWPDRTIYFQWHRGDQPEFSRAFAARSQRFKLLRAEGPPKGQRPPLELFDIEHDQFEIHDLAATQPEMVNRMYLRYLDWFRDVCGTRGFEPVRITIGDPRENPTRLTRQDWRVGDVAYPGHWELEVVRNGRYDLMIHVSEITTPTEIRLDMQGQIHRQTVATRASSLTLRGVPLSSGPTRLDLGFEHSDNGVRILDATVMRVGDK
jgi:arylsulfatase A-like enzyme